MAQHADMVSLGVAHLFLLLPAVLVQTTWLVVIRRARPAVVVGVVMADVAAWALLVLPVMAGRWLGWTDAMPPAWVVPVHLALILVWVVGATYLAGHALWAWLPTWPVTWRATAETMLVLHLLLAWFYVHFGIGQALDMLALTTPVAPAELAADAGTVSFLADPGDRPVVLRLDGQVGESSRGAGLPWRPDEKGGGLRLDKANLTANGLLVTWSSQHATVLPSGRIVFQLGPHVMVFDRLTMRLATFGRGHRPVVRLDATGPTASPSRDRGAADPAPAASGPSGR